MSETQVLKYEVQDGVGIITVDNPPVNALGSGVREGIMAAVERANADPEVRAMVLIGAGRNFIAGADMRQFGKGRPVSTRNSTAAMDASEKPIVAAIDGYALGGGLEHALACHYRIGTKSAKLGLPEVSIGMVPGGGGTQRLPRLLGAEAALDMIFDAKPVAAQKALKLGILDEIVDGGELRAAAVRYAHSVAGRRPLPRVRDMAGRIAEDRQKAGLFENLRKSAAKKSRGLVAPMKAIDCVEAATTLDFEAGIEFEREVFAVLENSDEAKALRYAFFAEREAAKIPGAPEGVKPAAVKSGAVIGAGTMGGGIAMCFADMGLPVMVLDATPEALERGMQRVRENYAIRVKRGSLTQQAMDERMALIRTVERYEDIADCDAVVEAVFERVDIKQDVFARLDAVMKPGALLLTNSSAIDINVMADATKRPGDVAGAHFFAPANVMKLCEIVRGDQSSMETILRSAKMGRDLGKVSVVAGTCDGFVANRSRTPMMTETMLMLEEGARPEQIDRVMVAFGYPMGPFAVNDLSGLDVSYEGRKRRAAADPTYRKLHVPDRLVEMGRKGQKTGAGWYRYEAGDRTPLPDDVVMQVVAGVAQEFGIEQRTFSDEEILHRLLFASVNEACKILEDGKAYRGSDIDVVWLNGFGFPRHRGGLMFWADSVGAGEIHRQVTQWHERYGKRWKPSTLLALTAQTGGTLRDATAQKQGAAV